MEEALVRKRYRAGAQLGVVLDGPSCTQGPSVAVSLELTLAWSYSDKQTKSYATVRGFVCYYCVLKKNVSGASKN